MGDRKLGALSREEFAAVIDERRLRRMNEIDAMPAELRGLVNDYGYTVVHMLMDLGIRKPAQVRHVVETVLNEFSPTRGSFSSQGIRTRHDAPNPKAERAQA